MGNGVLYIWWVLSLITVGYLPNCSLSLSNLVGFLFLLLLFLLFVCIIVIISMIMFLLFFIAIAVLFVRFSLPLLVLGLGLHVLVLSGLLVSSTVYV